jgi:hypothetical protein
MTPPNRAPLHPEAIALILAVATCATSDPEVLVQFAADLLGVPAEPVWRARLSTLKDLGLLERVSEGGFGLYQVTAEGTQALQHALVTMSRIAEASSKVMPGLLAGGRR